MGSKPLLDASVIAGSAGDPMPILAHLREHEIRWSTKGVLSQIELAVEFGAAEAREEARP